MVCNLRQIARGVVSEAAGRRAADPVAVGSEGGERLWREIGDRHPARGRQRPVAVAVIAESLRPVTALAGGGQAVERVVGVALSEAGAAIDSDRLRTQVAVVVRRPIIVSQAEGAGVGAGSAQPDLGRLPPGVEVRVLPQPISCPGRGSRQTGH